MSKRWAEDDFPPPKQPRLNHLSTPSNYNIYTMYHGTTKAAADIICSQGFRQSSEGMLGPGVYLSRDLRKASRYPIPKKGQPKIPVSQKVVLRVKVNVGKVITINYQGHPLQETWHNHGYDTAWCPPNCGMVPSGLEEDCVWDPSRISIINVIKPKVNAGDYDTDDESD